MFKGQSHLKVTARLLRKQENSTFCHNLNTKASECTLWVHQASFRPLSLTTVLSTWTYKPVVPWALFILTCSRRAEETIWFISRDKWEYISLIKSIKLISFSQKGVEILLNASIFLDAVTGYQKEKQDIFMCSVPTAARKSCQGVKSVEFIKSFCPVAALLNITLASQSKGRLMMYNPKDRNHSQPKWPLGTFQKLSMLYEWKKTMNCHGCCPWKFSMNFDNTPK